MSHRKLHWSAPKDGWPTFDEHGRRVRSESNEAEPAVVVHGEFRVEYDDCDPPCILSPVVTGVSRPADFDVYEDVPARTGDDGAEA